MIVPVLTYVSAFDDPTGSGAIASAVQWLEQLLLGTVATTLATIAVAAIGFGLLTGRVKWRRGITVLFGCFILFGAATIAAGLRSMLDGTGVTPPTISTTPPTPVLPPPQAYDPYAGAAVIQ